MKGTTLNRTALTVILGVISGIVAGVSAFTVLSMLPPSEADMKRTRFYSDGADAGNILQNIDKFPNATSRTCDEFLVSSYKLDTIPDYAKPQTDDDRKAFMMGCNDGLYGRAM